MSKILFLTPQLPYPPQQGASLRNYHIIRGLAERYDITLLSFLEGNQSIEFEDASSFISLCEEVVTVPAPNRNSLHRMFQLVGSKLPDMALRLASPEYVEVFVDLALTRSFDIVLVGGLELAWMINHIRIVTPGSQIVFDEHNAETELQRRIFLTDLRSPKRWLAALYSWLQIGRLQRYERWACEKADWVTAVSDTDKQNLQMLISKSIGSITVIPNCIDVIQFQTDAKLVECEHIPRFDLLFSGKMDYRPNVDAVLWFADEIWPLILEKRPETTWVIIGQKPHSRLNRLNKLTGVTITGWVESIRPYLAGADICIMPLRMGSGTRLKLIEAMASGKAVVSTPMGAEGFSVKHDRELLLIENEPEFAEAIIHLLSHPEDRNRIGGSARQFAQKYDWRNVIPRFDELFQQMLGEVPGKRD